MESVTKEIREKRDKFIEISANNIKRQIETRNGIQGAASKVLSFTAIFITVILAIYKNGVSGSCNCFLFVPIIFGLISIILLIECIKSTPFLIGVDEKDLEKMADDSIDDIILHEMNVLMSASINNTEILKNIRKTFTFGLYTMLISLISSIIFLLINMPPYG